MYRQPARSTALGSSTRFRWEPRTSMPRSVPRVAVEAGVTDFWFKYVGLEGKVIGIDTFGESAPAPVLFKHFGFTAENVADTVHAALLKA